MWEYPSARVKSHCAGCFLSLDLICRLTHTCAGAIDLSTHTLTHLIKNHKRKRYTQVAERENQKRGEGNEREITKESEVCIDQHACIVPSIVQTKQTIIRNESTCKDGKQSEVDHLGEGESWER